MNRKTFDVGEIMSKENVRREEFVVEGETLVEKIKELVHEGNIRRVIIKNEEGRTLVDIPLTVGVLGALVVPQLAAIGAIAVLVSKATIVVEVAE
jgi:CBS domain-containing protein